MLRLRLLSTVTSNHGSLQACYDRRRAKTRKTRSTLKGRKRRLQSRNTSSAAAADVVIIDDESTIEDVPSDLGENEYVVDKILAHGMSNDRVPVMIFKVKWQGYNAASDHTWETVESFNDPAIVLEYMRKAELTTNQLASTRQDSRPSKGSSRVLRTPLRPGRTRPPRRFSGPVTAGASLGTSRREQHVGTIDPDQGTDMASGTFTNQPDAISNEVEATSERSTIKREPDGELVDTAAHALTGTQASVSPGPESETAHHEQSPSPERTDTREADEPVKTVADLENAEARVHELEQLLERQSDTSHQLAVERDELQNKQNELQQHMGQLEEQNKVLLSSNASYRRLNEILTQKVEALQVDATIAAQEKDALLQYAHQALKGSQANRASGTEDEVSRLRKDNDEFRNSEYNAHECKHDPIADDVTGLAKLEANAIAGAEDAT